jgi:hypothetical protein
MIHTPRREATCRTMLSAHNDSTKKRRQTDLLTCLQTHATPHVTLQAHHAVPTNRQELVCITTPDIAHVACSYSPAEPSTCNMPAAACIIVFHRLQHLTLPAIPAIFMAQGLMMPCSTAWHDPSALQHFCVWGWLPG